MAFDPKSITKEHVLNAVKTINEQGLELTPSKKWHVIINDTPYPPKEIMRYARAEYDGSLDWPKGGGWPTNDYLKNMGFKLLEKTKTIHPLNELIKKYKAYVKENGVGEELYKWRLLEQFKGRPNPEVTNFKVELNTINFSNLIYPIGVNVIKHIVSEREERYRNEFKMLFNEKLTLEDRIRDFSNNTLAIYRELITNERFSHHHDERTISTFLTYHNPEKYTFYKNSFYQKLCKLLKIKSKPKGYKYLHYLELVEDFIENYIKQDLELVELIRHKIPNEAFSDRNHYILAQDILYRTLDKQLGVRRAYWRVGTKDDHQSYWKVMLENDYISIGWAEIGDLSDKDVKNKEDILRLFNDEGFYKEKNKKNVASRKAGEIFNFYENINIGDVVLAQDGADILGVGIITDDYSYVAEEAFPHIRPVEWKSTSVDFSNQDGKLTTVKKITDLNTIHRVERILSSMKNISLLPGVTSLGQTRLNQILYGPPGTGKTYATKAIAVSIAAPDFTLKSSLTENEQRKQLTEQYELLRKDGQIVFTTFHQSYSYEDFVEGIKPALDNNEKSNDLEYSIEAGIFKICCAQAAYNCYILSKSQENKNSYTYDDLYEAFIDQFREQEEKPIFNTITGKEVEIFEINRNDSIRARARGSKAINVAPLTKENIQKLYDTFSTIDEINNLKQVRDTVGVKPRITEFYAIFRGLKEFEKKEYENFQKEDIEFDELGLEDTEIIKKFSAGVFDKAVKQYSNQAAPVVLIIDEINRGNVSAIFGELITLIEKDKRIGKEEELRVKLPYTKSTFGVPANVYIIGTMNTADRSVEALDTALRRRFSFEEVMPNPELLRKYDVKGINLKDLLKIINDRIEILLDRDHTIGHSYFFKVYEAKKPEEKLVEVFKDNIIPLLKEYFFGEYSKIGLILGDSFIKVDKEENQRNILAAFDGDVEIIVGDKYELIPPNQIDLQKIESILKNG